MSSSIASIGNAVVPDFRLLVMKVSVSLDHISVAVRTSSSSVVKLECGEPPVDVARDTNHFR